MKIALIGYGRMGKEIASVAKERGHEISLIIDLDNQKDFKEGKLEKADVAIEFTNPDAAPDNLVACFNNSMPVVSGTTGWLDR
mgnify:FL=1